MLSKKDAPPRIEDMKRIRVSENGLYIVSGGIPLSAKKRYVTILSDTAALGARLYVSPAGTICIMPLWSIEKQIFLRRHSWNNSFRRNRDSGRYTIS